MPADKVTTYFLSLQAAASGEAISLLAGKLLSPRFAPHALLVASVAGKTCASLATTNGSRIFYLIAPRVGNHQTKAKMASSWPSTWQATIEPTEHPEIHYTTHKYKMESKNAQA